MFRIRFQKFESGSVSGSKVLFTKIRTPLTLRPKNLQTNKIWIKRLPAPMFMSSHEIFWKKVKIGSQLLYRFRIRQFTSDPDGFGI